MKFTAMGQWYTLQMEGKAYPLLFWGTSAWRQIDGMRCEIAIKQDGKLINTTRRRVRILESTVYMSTDAHIQLAHHDSKGDYR